MWTEEGSEIRLIQRGIGQNYFHEVGGSPARDYMYEYIQFEEIKENKERRQDK